MTSTPVSATRGSLELAALHAFATDRLTAEVTDPRLGTDAAGEYFQCHDLNRGIGWRARLLDPATGTWTQDIWLLPSDGARDGWFDVETARLGLHVAMNTADPIRRLTHQLPTRSDRDSAEGLFYDLDEAADAIRLLAPWEDRFDLTDGRIRNGGGQHPDHAVVFAEGIHGPHRLTMTYLPLQEIDDTVAFPAWALYITDANVPVTDKQRLPQTRWAAAVRADQREMTYEQFFDLFARLLRELHPVDGQSGPVPAELQALGERFR